MNETKRRPVESTEDFKLRIAAIIHGGRVEPVAGDHANSMRLKRDIRSRSKHVTVRKRRRR